MTLPTAGASGSDAIRKRYHQALKTQNIRIVCN